jgi:hypothetical protein
LALGSTATSQVCREVGKKTASFFWNVPTAMQMSPVSCWSCTGRNPASLGVVQSRALPAAQYFTVWPNAAKMRDAAFVTLLAAGAAVTMVPATFPSR